MTIEPVIRSELAGCYSGGRPAFLAGTIEGDALMRLSLRMTCRMAEQRSVKRPCRTRCQEMLLHVDRQFGVGKEWAFFSRR